MKIACMSLLVLCGMLLVSCQKEQVVQGREPFVRKSGKTLMMHYMPWYETPAGRGRWGSHWAGHESEHKPDRAGVDGLPDIWSHFHPLIGLYDSIDRDVLECHLLQMKIAGVDGVIVDWYGLGKAADYPPIHEASRAMFDAAGRHGMKFAVCYEDRSVAYMEELKMLKPEQVREHLTETVQWMQLEWFQKPQYFRMAGRPLLLNFGPIHIHDPADWSAALGSVPDRPAFFGLHHLWKNAGGDGGFSWVHKNAWQGKPEESVIHERLYKEFTHASNDPAKLIVSAYPGFMDVYKQSHPILEHRDGATMRESLRACMKGPWDVVQLITWNDYGEGTMIEPTHEFGYTFLEIIQDERRKELGPDFPFRPEDLKLPAELLAIRREAGVTRLVGDRIARHLINGDCETARKEIAQARGK